MSYVKFSPNLFLESQELNRFKKSLDDDGFRKLFLLDSLSFGVVNSSTLGNFSNFKIEAGTNVGTIKLVNDSFAIDSDGQIITKLAFDNFSVTNDNSWYWVKIAFAYTPVELGTVSVDVAGNITGVGTEFTKILRGLPNIPSRIKFPNAATNTGEYDIQSVTSDTAAVISIASGVLAAESNLTLSVIGSFSPDYIPSTPEKEIFQYNSSLVTLVAEVTPSVPPASVAGKEFYIARIRRNGATLNIEDKRSLNIYKSKSDYIASTVVDASNPLIGVEAIKYDAARSTRSQNLVYIAWSFRSDNWTIDPNTNKVTLNSGLGGKFKATTDFTNGDFNGWRLYTKDGTYSIIQASAKVGSQINLTLDTLEPTKFSDTASMLNITPNNEEIQLYFSGDVIDEDELTQKKITYPINTTFAVVPLLAYASPTCLYGFRFRYKTLNTFGVFQAMPSDLVSGFLNESSFDANGDLGVASRTTYTGSLTASFITITEAINSYRNLIGGLTTGDLFGVEYKTLSNASPLYSLQVGVRKQNQIFTGPVTFSVDQFISLETVGAVAGNTFILDFRAAYTPGAFQLRINQNFVSVGTPGTNLVTFIPFDYRKSTSADLFFRFVFDGTNWVEQKIASQVTAIESPDLNQIYTKKITVTWDMDADDQIAVTHGLDPNKIIGVLARLTDASLSNKYLLPITTINGGYTVSTTQVFMEANSGFGSTLKFNRFIGSVWDGPSFNAALLTVTIFYEP